MTRKDAHDFLSLAGEIGFNPRIAAFSLEDANEAVEAVKHETEEGPAVIVVREG